MALGGCDSIASVFPMAGIAQLARASDCGSECRGFEPRFPPQLKRPDSSRIRSFLISGEEWVAIVPFLLATDDHEVDWGCRHLRQNLVLRVGFEKRRPLRNQLGRETVRS